MAFLYTYHNLSVRKKQRTSIDAYIKFSAAKVHVLIREQDIMFTLYQPCMSIFYLFNDPSMSPEESKSKILILKPQTTKEY